MEIELREVQNRFQSKRKPILDAIKLKKQSSNQDRKSTRLNSSH